MSKRLNIYTAGYPYGFVEPFLNNEIDEICKSFDKVSIFPYKKIGKIQSSYSQDCQIFLDTAKEQQFILKFRDRLFILRILWIEFIHIQQKLFFLRKLKRHTTILKNGVLLSKWILQQNDKNVDSIHYSYWMDEWALALAVLKKRKKIKKFVFRVNGYDIWNERHEGNYLPFRYFNYSQVEKIFTLSETSEKYLKDLGFFPKKVSTAYYGTKDLGIVSSESKDKFVVFSCSGAIPLKRLEKIAEVLCATNFPIKWIHHGDGPTMNGVFKILKNKGKNIEFVHSPHKENYYEVLLFMKNSDPDLFINLSETEGLPVTIMEAMSLGIPVLANDVGSCSEFFKSNIGVLVNKDDDAESIAQEVIDLIEKRITVMSSEEIKEVWRSNFWSISNYQKFAKVLQEL